MRFEDLIETVSEIAENKHIQRDGLVLLYYLDEKNHKQMDEHLFYKANPEDTEFIHRDVVEVEIAGIIVRFLNKDLDIEE